MGRWSRRLARDFVLWLNPATSLHWLEAGCGTGALTSAICAQAQPASVTACDPAAPFIEYARAQLNDRRASFLVASAHDFPLRSNGYDQLTSLLALNFIPEPGAALERMCAAAVAGGTISAAVWDYAGGMQMLRYFWNAATEVVPGAAEFDEGRRFPLCAPGPLTDLFGQAGLVEVRCEALDIVTDFANVEEFWALFSGGTGPAPAYVATLDPATRAAMRARLDASLPRDPDGSVRLRARAWAVRGMTRSA